VRAPNNSKNAYGANNQIMSLGLILLNPKISTTSPDDADSQRCLTFRRRRCEAQRRGRPRWPPTSPRSQPPPVITSPHAAAAAAAAGLPHLPYFVFCLFETYNLTCVTLHAPPAPTAADGAETETDEEGAAARVDKREIGALAAGPHSASHFHLNLHRSKPSFITVLPTALILAVVPLRPSWALGGSHLVVPRRRRQLRWRASPRRARPWARVWSVTSAKPGNGVELLRDKNLETYWQVRLKRRPHTRPPIPDSSLPAAERLCPKESGADCVTTVGGFSS
jgi:hypothetical protein